MHEIDARGECLPIGQFGLHRIVLVVAALEFYGAGVGVRRHPKKEFVYGDGGVDGHQVAPLGALGLLHEVD